MKNLNLFQAAVELNQMHSPVPSETKNFVTKRFGLKEGNLQPVAIIGQMKSLIEKALEESKNFIGFTTENYTDSVYKQSGLKINASSVHPLDQAFLIIESAVNSSTEESRRFKKIQKSDPVNDFLAKKGGPASSEGSIITDFSYERGVAEVYSLINKIYTWNCPSGKQGSMVSADPADEIAAKLYGNGRFYVEPSKTKREWNALLEKAIGLNLSSEETLRDKIFEATYQVTYILNENTPEHERKTSELNLLQGMLASVRENKALLGESSPGKARILRGPAATQTKGAPIMHNCISSEKEAPVIHNSISSEQGAPISAEEKLAVCGLLAAEGTISNEDMTMVVEKLNKSGLVDQDQLNKIAKDRKFKETTTRFLENQLGPVTWRWMGERFKAFISKLNGKYYG